MRPHHHTLTAHQVHRSATRHLQAHPPLRDYKRKVTAPTLWAVLVVAAAGVTSGGTEGVMQIPAGGLGCLVGFHRALLSSSRPPA
jgi:hypothetical protein